MQLRAEQIHWVERGVFALHLPPKKSCEGTQSRGRSSLVSA